LQQFAIIKLMVKFRGKPKRKKSAEEVAAAPHVYTAPGGRNPLRVLRNISRQRKLTLLVAAGVVLVCAGILAYKTVGPGKRPPHGQTSQQGFANYLEELENNPPAASATKSDKAMYYKKLSVTKADVGDYKGAIAAFNSGVQTEAGTFDYVDYINLAGYYQELGDKQGANSALDKASRSLPSADNPDTGYVRADQQQIIDSRREAYGL
jgi:tetratricopeptide (TPR) repeat protein